MEQAGPRFERDILPLRARTSAQTPGADQALDRGWSMLCDARCPTERVDRVRGLGLRRYASPSGDDGRASD